MFPFYDQAGTPIAPTPPRWNPPPISREKKKPPISWGDRQLCQSRRPSPESCKVVRAKVGKVVGKSWESRGKVAKVVKVAQSSES